MRLVRDKTWARRGFSWVWGPEALTEVAGQLITLRELFRLGEGWPEELPCGDGRTLAVAGLEGFLDVLAPEDAEQWLEEDLRPRLLSFQDAYQTQAGLIFWLPVGRKRIGMNPATETYSWKCAPPFSARTIELGRLLWAGAQRDVGRILDGREKNQDPDGPAWVGLHHPRIS